MKCAVVYAANDKYSKVLGVSLMSFFDNNKSIKDVDIYIFDNGIGNDNLRRFNVLASMYKRKINVVNIEDKLSKVNRVKEAWDISTYSRFFIQDILPDDVERVLYLDCDTLVLGDVSKLFKFPFEKDKIVYGVLDRYNVGSLERIGIDDGIYINAGVLLIDLKEWREQQIADDLLAQCGTRKWQFADQDIINYELNGKIGVLHPKYNVNKFTSVLPYEYSKELSYEGIEKFYSEEMYNQSQNKPCIVHFSGSMFNRPWQKNSRQPYHDIWDKYWMKSPWKNVIPVKRTYTQKVSSTIYMWLTEKILWHYWNKRNYKKFVYNYIKFNELPNRIKALLRKIR